MATNQGGLISTSTVEAVKSAMQILDVTQAFITDLKKSGSSWKAKSPKTNEKTASFNVVPSKNIFKDFSSGEGGDCFKYLMSYEGMSFTEAVKWLAKYYNIPVEYQTKTELTNKDHQRAAIIRMNEFACEYFEKNLRTPQGLQALAYLELRGYTEEQIKKYRIGFALNDWSAIIKAAEARFGYEIRVGGDLVKTREFLNVCSLANVKEKFATKAQGQKRSVHYYDAFRSRIMFPWVNEKFEVIGFGGRIFGQKHNSDHPKYINSRENEVYDKSASFYGLNYAYNQIRKTRKAYISEGYTDVIASQTAEVLNTVSIGGTSFVHKHSKNLKAICDEVVVLFDGDLAGIKAIDRAIDKLVGPDIIVKCVRLPSGMDPDEFVAKKGDAAYREYLANNEEDFLEFKALQLIAKKEALSDYEYADGLRSIIQCLSRLKDPTVIYLKMDKLSKLVNIDMAILTAEMTKHLDFTEQKIKKKEEMELDPLKGDNIFVSTNPDELILRLMLTNNMRVSASGIPILDLIIEYIYSSGVELKDVRVKRVFNLVVQMRKEGKEVKRKSLSEADPEMSDYLNKITEKNFKVQELIPQGNADFNLVNRLKKKLLTWLMDFAQVEVVRLKEVAERSPSKQSQDALLRMQEALNIMEKIKVYK